MVALYSLCVCMYVCMYIELGRKGRGGGEERNMCVSWRFRYDI